jgi:hypothetical protein
MNASHPAARFFDVAIPETARLPCGCSFSFIILNHD